MKNSFYRKNIFNGDLLPCFLYLIYTFKLIYFIIFKEINECTDNTNNCNAFATCSNTEGSYICTCNNGYSGDGINCLGGFVTATNYANCKIVDELISKHEIKQTCGNIS